MNGHNWKSAATLVALLIVHASAATLYVDVNSTNAIAPYTNWATASLTIQAAVDAAVAGDEVVVTNGVYVTGGRPVYGSMTNRVAVIKPLTVRSLNGQQFTFIQGYQVPVRTNGDGAMRCVYLADGAVLSGFTLTNGGTRASGDSKEQQSGGGVRCQSTNALVNDCTITGNSASSFGGGISSGTADHCTLVGNSSWTLGGGAYLGTLNNCTLSGNSAGDGGGGSFYATMNNCMVASNSAVNYGSGVYGGSLNY